MPAGIFEPYNKNAVSTALKTASQAAFMGLRWAASLSTHTLHANCFVIMGHNSFRRALYKTKDVVGTGFAVRCLKHPYTGKKARHQGRGSDLVLGGLCLQLLC